MADDPRHVQQRTGEVATGRATASDPVHRRADRACPRHRTRRSRYLRRPHRRRGRHGALRVGRGFPRRRRLRRRVHRGRDDRFVRPHQQRARGDSGDRDRPHAEARREQSERTAHRESVSRGQQRAHLVSEAGRGVAPVVLADRTARQRRQDDGGGNGTVGRPARQAQRQVAHSIPQADRLHRVASALRRKPRFAVGLACALVVAGMTPLKGVPYATSPAEQARSAPFPPRFEEALTLAADLPRLHSLIVSRRGEILLERYYNGARATRAANIKSAAKSLISALVGIAIDRRLIPGTDTPIVQYFPALSKDRDPDKRKITVEDLLTMRSGLETTSNRNYGAWVQSRN